MTRDVELIVKIPEDLCTKIYSDAEIMIYGGMRHSGKTLLATLLRAIRNGVILPKGHGRLIDADAFERRCMFDSNVEDMQDVIYALRDYKPTIEADKAESEG